MLRDIMTGSSNPTLAPYAKEGEVMLRITASAPTEAEGYAMMQPMMEQIQPVIEPYLYGVDVPDLQTALVNYLLEHNITLNVDAAACDFIANAGYDPDFGARPLKRAVIRLLETPLSHRIIAGEIADGETVNVTADGEGLTFN